MRAYYNYSIHLFYVETIHFVLCYLANDLFKWPQMKNPKKNNIVATPNLSRQKRKYHGDIKFFMAKLSDTDKKPTWKNLTKTPLKNPLPTKIPPTKNTQLPNSNKKPAFSFFNFFVWISMVLRHYLRTFHLMLRWNKWVIASNNWQMSYNGIAGSRWMSNRS